MDDGQLNIQQQINQVVKDRSKLFAEQTNMLTAQARIAKQLCKALECQELDDLDERLNRIKENEGIEKLTEDVKKSGQAARSATDDFGALKKAAAAGALAGFVGGVKSAFGGAIKTIRNVANAIGGIISAVGKVGLSIISIPFKLFGGLISMAQQGGGGADALRQAYEDVRKEFGSLTSNEGKALKGTLKDLKGQMGDLAGTGLRMGKIFGYGREGMAEFLKMNAELATALGGAFNMVKHVIEKNAVALAMYRKGLGMTAEAQGSIIAKAEAFGKDPMEEMRKFGDAAVRLGAKFGISSKVMGKNMSKLVEDFDHFGTFGPEMIGQVVAQAQRLGVEVEKLTGIMDAFSSFDSAHDRSAKLYQMFGMNIDAMKMMKEQDPAKQLSMMQEAFAKSGASVETMHHSQLKQLASLTNLDTKTAAFAFSQRGLSKSYGDVQKEMDKKHKKEKTQAEIMKDISKNIAKLVKQGGGGGFKGFFDAFSKGFQKGILKSKEFRKIFRNINKSLRIVYNSGIRVGDMFVKIFPGMKKFTTGLGGLFDPKHMKKLMRELEGGFKQLFLALQKDPDSGWEPFFERTKKAFMRFFGVKKGFGKLMLVGLKIIGRALSGLIGQMIRGLVPLLSEGLRNIAAFVRTGSLEAITSNLDGSIFKPIVEALIAVGPELLDAFKDLWDAIYTKARPYLMTGLKYLMTYIFGKMMLTVLMSTLTGAISAAIAGGGLKMIMSGLGMGGPGGGGMGGTPAQGVQQAQGLKKSAQQIVDGINSGARAIGNLDGKAMIKAGFKMSIMVVSFMMPLGTLLMSLVGLAVLMGQFAPLDFSMKVLGMVFAIGALYTMGKTIDLLSKLPKGAILKGLPAVVGLSIIVGGIALLMAGISKAFNNENPLNLVVMTAALALFLFTVMAVAIASIAIGALLGGAQAAVLIPMAAIGLTALIAVAVATGALMVAFRESFGKVSAEEADTLLKVSKAAINVVNAVATTFQAAMSAGGGVALNAISKLTGNDPVTKGIDNLTKMTKPIGSLIIGIIKNITAAAKNAAGFERVAKAFGDVMKAVAPVFKVAADLTAFALSALDEGVEPDKIAKMMDKASATTEKITGSVQNFIKNISKISMTENQIKTATALAPIISAAASMLGAISSPMTALASAAKETTSTSGTTKVGYSAVYGLAEGEAEVGFNRVNKSFASGKFKKAADTVGGIIPKILESLAGSMGKMIDSIKGISGKLSRREAKQVVRTMKVLGEVFKSMAAATGVVKDILGLKTTTGEQKSMTTEGVKGGASVLGTGGSFENINKTEITGKSVNMMQQLEMVTGLLLGESLDGVKDPKLHGGLLGIGIKFIDRMKGYKDKIPDMGIATEVAAAYSLVFNKLVDGFSVKSKNMKTALDSVRQAEDLVDAYKKIMSIQEFADIDKAQKVYDTIVKLNSAFQEASANIHVLEPFKGGKLKVSHKVENINLTMTVTIDSRVLASELVKVSQLNAPFAGQRIATETS